MRSHCPGARACVRMPPTVPKLWKDSKAENPSRGGEVPPPTRSTPIPGLPRTFPALGGAPPKSSLQLPALNRSTSSGRPQFSGGDWRINVAIEERTAVRSKIKESYGRLCPSYEELLKLCVAIDEELIFSGCETRMEYFKNAVQWGDRLQIKVKQLSGTLQLGGSSGAMGPSRLKRLAAAASASAALGPPSKRGKTSAGEGSS